MNSEASFTFARILRHWENRVRLIFTVARCARR